MLAPGLSLELDAGSLQAEYEAIIAYGDGPADRVEVANTLRDWPGKQSNDAGCGLRRHDRAQVQRGDRCGGHARRPDSRARMGAALALSLHGARPTSRLALRSGSEHLDRAQRGVVLLDPSHHPPVAIDLLPLVVVVAEGAEREVLRVAASRRARRTRRLGSLPCRPPRRRERFRAGVGSGRSRPGRCACRRRRHRVPRARLRRGPRSCRWS